MVASQRELDGAIAVTRFGLGAKAGEIAAASKDPRGSLRAQIRREGADTFATGGETSTQRLAEFRDYRRQREMAKRDGEGKGGEGKGRDGQAKAGETADAADPVKMAQQFIRQNAAGDVMARTQLATTTDAGFRERWALFWANHFTVSASKVQVATLVGPFENEAIRPNVFGRFADLVGAAETHPAMLLYLDQAQSVGPNSRAAEYLKRGDGRRGAAFGGPGVADPQPRRTPGLNENLAREIMELHTVGIDGGYSQADVTEFARALTGLSISGPRDPVQDQVVFRDTTHEPGARTVMGVRYAPGDKSQANAILTDLAGKPATAKFVCTKIARHFVADDPPPGLVARLQKTWMASGGDLGRVAETLIDAPEAWSPQPVKFKTPYEFVVSSYRAVGETPRGPGQVNQALNALGQRPFSAPSPKGWPDEAGPWAASDAIVKRMQFAQALAATVGPNVQDPMQLADATLGARLSPAAALAIGRAESRGEAVALLLMTPEFQRR
ncbi:DUF1800 family protein [Phenylobacterium sp.]|uniref:DUF1800 domain-containing protein n=1 Tax=Phenylobacterium sp. TaxID=1871053 RepID=UPI0025FEF015|nr:DUF1800 family protein [Phenylobacterium sp.]